MHVRAFIFDLDGTLVDSLGDIAAAMNRALASFGWPTHDHVAYRRFVGEGVAHLARLALPPGPAAESRHGELVAAYQRDYAEHLADTTRPFPGVAALVADLARRRAPVAVLSNKPDGPTRLLCEQLFPAGSFVAVQGQRDGVPKKPDPTAALALAAALGAAPADIAFIGDTAVDVHTARAAGMRAVGVTWGFRPDELVAAGAELVVSEASALLPLLAWPTGPAR